MLPDFIRHPTYFQDQRLTNFNPQALEGKDIKDLLTNVGSAGPAAPAAAGGAAAAPEAAVEEKKEEGKF